MSASAYYQRVSQDELGELMSNNERLKRFQFGIEGDVKATALRMLDLGESQAVLHLVLTGTAFPRSTETQSSNVLTTAIVGGRPVGEDYTGYGPARYLTPAEVKQIAAALEMLDFDELVSKCSPDDFANLCSGYGSGDFEEEIEGLQEEYFPEFKKFFLEAAKNGEAVLMHIA